MSVKLKPLREQTIVITGASSGIGLATAKRAAKAGARVVLTARDQPGLDAIVREIEADGGQAIAVAADVADFAALQRVADAAIARFGGFDTWVNDAGVDLFGRLDEISEADHRRLFETNFWGQVHGSLIAADTLSERGGALINIGSIASDQVIPLQGMYSASKHAVKAFTIALRMELEAEGAPVSVTLVKPAAIGTPLEDRLKNYDAREPKLPPPVYAPEDVAYAILHAAVSPKRDITVGGAGKAITLFGAHAPRLMDRLSESFGMAVQRRREPARARTDNLYEPGTAGEVRGERQGSPTMPNLYTRMALNPAKTSAVLALLATAAGLGTVAWSRRNRHWERPW